jgi:hypothetical protein
MPGGAPPFYNHCQTIVTPPCPWSWCIDSETLKTTMTKVIDQHRDEVAALCRQAGARRLDVFGSAARADFDPATSDLDFLVEFDALPPVKLADAYFGLKEGLEALFGRPVDLVTESSLSNPYFRERVMAERRAVYAR